MTSGLLPRNAGSVSFSLFPPARICIPYRFPVPVMDSRTAALSFPPRSSGSF